MYSKVNQLYVYPFFFRFFSHIGYYRIQRNTQQMKEQGKNPPDQTNEEEIGSLPEKEGENSNP